MELFWQDIKEIFNKYTENIIIAVIGIILFLVIFHFFFSNRKSEGTWGEEYGERQWFRFSGRIDLSDKPGTDEYGNSEETRNKYRDYRKLKLWVLIIILFLLLILRYKQLFFSHH
ncbi:MAG: hypothetical protein K1X86_05380 [Ignavibacteria bacterium]|nr:hypothetical protein [Ignavibacteria bacterium]